MEHGNKIWQSQKQTACHIPQLHTLVLRTDQNPSKYGTRQATAFCSRPRQLSHRSAVGGQNWHTMAYLVHDQIRPDHTIQVTDTHDNSRCGILYFVGQRGGHKGRCHSTQACQATLNYGGRARCFQHAPYVRTRLDQTRPPVTACIQIQIHSQPRSTAAIPLCNGGRVRQSL